MPVVPAVLVASLVAAQAQAPPGPDSIVWQAARAASGDSAAAMAARWRSRLDQAPSDPAASLGLAALAFYTFDYDDALARYRDLAAAPGPDAWTVRARLGVGYVEHRRGNFVPADSEYARAAAGARVIADSAALADALINLAMVRARTRGADAAISFFDQAAEVLPGANDRQRALHRCARGVAFFGLGNRSVITGPELEEGARIAERAGEPALKAVCVFGRAVIFMARGVTDSVLVLLNEVVDLQRRANDRYGLAGVLQRRSWYLRAIGDYAAADASLREALEHAAVSANASVEAWASIDLANIALRLQDRVSAVQDVDRAEALFEQQNDRWGLAAVTTIRAQLSVAAGDFEAARQYYERAAARQVAAGDGLGAIGSYSALGEIALHQGRLDHASEMIEQARRIAESGGMTGWERGLRAREARLAIARGETAAGRAILDTLLRTPHQPNRYYELRVLRSLASVRDGDLAAAEAQMVEAGDALDVWRTSLSDRDFRIQAFQPKETASGAATIIAALAEGGRLEAAVRIAEQRRARELSDRIALARAMQSSEPAPRAPHPTGLTGFDVWRATAGPSTGLLYYVTGDGEPTTLVAIGPDTALARVLPPIDSLARAIDRYRGLVQSDADARPAAAHLARLLFAGVLEDPGLAAARRLVIVPDGPLHRLPFASLILRDGRYAIERYAIATAPSARVAMLLADGHTGDAPVTMLALGDPAAGDVASTSASSAYRPALGPGEPLPRLAAAGREVRRVARFAARADVRTGDAASEAWLQSADLGRYDILHFATHALVDEQSITGTALVLTPGGGEDGLLVSGELSDLRLSADLVVLSACESAGGIVLRGEGIHGLTAPLLEAGARAILATEWRIEDSAVTSLVDDFYGGLADGLDVAAALRSAQRAAISRGEPPARWAAFTLVGDPGVRLALHRPGRPPASRVLVLILVIGVALVTWRVSRRRRPSSAANEPARGRPHGA